MCRTIRSFGDALSAMRISPDAFGSITTALAARHGQNDVLLAIPSPTYPPKVERTWKWHCWNRRCKCWFQPSILQVFTTNSRSNLLQPCKGFDAPLVPRLKDKTFRDKMYQTLKESNPKDAEDFNQKFRPGAVLEWRSEGHERWT